MQPGDQFWVRGPFGTPWDLDLDGRDIVIAAGGIGLAPLRSAVYAVIKHRERYGKAILVVGARTTAQLLYANEYELWREHGLAVFDTIDQPEPGWSGRVGFVPDVVEQLGIDRTFDERLGVRPRHHDAADRRQLIVGRRSPRSDPAHARTQHAVRQRAVRPLPTGPASSCAAMVPWCATPPSPRR